MNGLFTEIYWDKSIETLDAAGLRDRQLATLCTTINRARNAAFYKDRLPAAPLKDLRNLQDLPFTGKEDLRANFPYGFLAVDKSEVVRLHSSSGTTGNPTVVYHTGADIAAWADLIARCMYMAGARRTDVFQNTMGYGLFTGGLGFHYGAEKLGMLTIPVGPGNGKRQVWFMKQFGTTAVHILPSYALHLRAQMDELGIDPRRDLSLRMAFVGAEPHTEAMRREIERRYGIKAFNSYGLSEICGPGVAFECPEQNGMHVWEDFVYPEIIDPATGKVLPDGEEGELVLTTLRREAMPLLRYRTRDLTRILPGPCPCGRSHRRIDRIKGRSDDMLIINGVNIFPMQIEKTILKVTSAGSNYIIEIGESDFMDKLSVSIEVTSGNFSDSLPELKRMQAQIAAELRAELGVSADVKLVEQGSLPVAEGKAKRVFDRRTKLTSQ